MNSTQQKKNVFVVIGMPRSGTSAIARGLQALGVDLGEKLTPGSKKWNPKGFFEDNDIVYKINRAALYTIDYAWTGINMIKPECYQHEALQPVKALGQNLLKARMADTYYWGFKDPRTVKILPFWQDIFTQLQVQDHYIIALRNPLASAYSYRRVTGTDIEVGLLMWLMHLIPAIDETHGKNRIMVSYDAIMQQPHAELERLRKGLMLPDLADMTEVDRYADTFLDKKLQHFDYEQKDFAAHPAASVTPLCVKMYDLFLQVAHDEITFDSPYFIAKWQVLKAEFNQIYPIYAYIDVLLKKNKQAERTLRSIRRSLPWKLLYPLRIIDDALRARRKKSREKRRLVREYS